jgi:hypothetical protein
VWAFWRRQKKKVSAATSRIRTCEPPSPQLIHHPDIHYFYFDIGQTCDAVPRRKDVLRSYSCRVSELSKENTSRQHFFCMKVLSLVVFHGQVSNFVFISTQDLLSCCQVCLFPLLNRFVNNLGQSVKETVTRV